MTQTTGPALGSGYEQRRIEELRRWKLRANSFLFGAFVVFLASHFLGSDSGINGFVRAASEAALIGGIADWLAVTALFRHPLGMPIPHTALIPKSKDEIGTGLAEFVQQNFLDPENLRQWIANADIANRVGRWLIVPENAAAAARRSIETGATLAKSLDDERVAAIVTETSLDWLRQTSVTPLISLVMDTWLKGGHVQDSIVATLRGVDLVVEENHASFRRSFVGAEPWWLPEWARERIFDRVIASFHVLVDEVVDDPEHPVRAELERMLTETADDLRNSAELEGRIEETKLRLLDSPDLATAIGAQWEVVHQSLQRSADAPGSDLERRLTELIQWWGARVLEDQQLRARIDNWIADSAERLARQWDDEVTGLIETTVERWDATEISHRLELQLGRDLQFVRINGTVVGALVGIAIHALLLLARVRSSHAPFRRNRLSTARKQHASSPRPRQATPSVETRWCLAGGREGKSSAPAEKEEVMTYDIYAYEMTVVPTGETPDISGFSVEATDGSIGTVDEHTYDVGASYLVVDTGPWIFGKKVMLPAGVIRQVDLDDEVIYVDRTKDEIKNSPEFNESTYRDETYRSNLGDYYASRPM